MQFGAVFPTTVLGRDPDDVGRWATAAEELGYDHVIAYDHVLGAPHDGRRRPLGGPYDERDEFHEPLTLFAFLAGITRRIRLMTGVVVAPQRQTALLAKQAAEVHSLSRGRLRLGVGTGWNWVEYEALGAEFASRGARLDEQIGLLRALWRDPLVTVSTPFHTIDRAGLAPRPDAPIEIWLGGYTEPALRRAARAGDGHLFGHLRPDTIAGAQRIAALLDQRGRDRRDFGLETVVDFGCGADEWSAAIARWAEAGGTHLAVRTMPTVGAPDSGCRTVDDHVHALEVWRDALAAAGRWQPEERRQETSDASS